jgi:cation diffusion facilitator CzcD-associated flavoprotein CzcO
MRTVDAIVVGAGFAGLFQVHRLAGLGLTVQGFDAEEGVGGTWLRNRYPGARCDIESVDYSYSFDPELEHEWDWSERYAAQPEILRYIEHVAERFDLRRHFLFGTRVESVVFDDKSLRWTVRTDVGELFSARYVVMATGCLSASRIPDFAGLERFDRPRIHTADWPSDPIDFSEMTVGVIGTGSTGIQCIPELAKVARKVVVFQRTPSFATSSKNYPLTDAGREAIKRTYPDRRQESRASWFGLPTYIQKGSAVQASEQERNERYEAAWARGELLGVLNSYRDIMADHTANETAAEFIRSKIRSIVRSPEIAAMLSPTGFAYGAKRPCLENGYFAAYNRDDVDLLDVRANPIREFDETGIVLEDGRVDLDAVVFATGFDAITGALLSVDIRGREGVALRDRWAGGPTTYLGLAASGFPNFFFVTGPGSPSVFSNVILSIEQHVEWITACLAYAVSRGCALVEATADAEREWTEHVNDLAAGTLFPSADSWYVGANVPGKPRVFMPYIGGVALYAARLTAVVDADYQGFVFSGELSHV